MLFVLASASGPHKWYLSIWVHIRDPLEYCVARYTALEIIGAALPNMLCAYRRRDYPRKRETWARTVSSTKMNRGKVFRFALPPGTHKPENMY